MSASAVQAILEFRLHLRAILSSRRYLSLAYKPCRSMDHRRFQPCQQSCQAVTMVNVAMGAVVARHLKVVADQLEVMVAASIVADRLKVMVAAGIVTDDCVAEHKEGT